VSRAPRPKHLMLLAVLILLQVAQPLLEHRSETTRILSDTVFVAICLYVFFIVCSERWQRIVGFALFVPVLAGNLALYTLDPHLHRTFGIVFHCALIVFLGFAVTVIVRDLFKKTVIRGDDVLGAICGYILGAMVWGNLYALTYLFAPHAFSVNPAIALQLDDWQLKRSLFDYLSFTTLTSLGYGDITPVGQPVYSLTWLEVLFGQFYMAVVVAQMVGLKLAQAIRGRGQESDSK
jgi:voltage-gated potassium channel